MDQKSEGQAKKVIENLFSNKVATDVYRKQINETKLQDIKNIVEQTKKYIDEVGLSKSDRTAINLYLLGLELEIVKDHPEPSKIFNFLSSIKRIIVGATGNVIAQGIVAVIDKII